MKAYFAASTANLAEEKDNYLAICTCLQKNGYELQPSWTWQTINKNKSRLSSKDLVLKNIHLIQNSDLVIVEMSTPSFGVGYIIGQALAYHKPVLCLYPQTIKEQEISDIVKGSTSSLMYYASYTPKNLSQVLKKYLRQKPAVDLRKFNFLVTPEIIDFIENGAKRENKSKSQYLRDRIFKELMGK